MIQATMIQARYGVQHIADNEGNPMVMVSFLDPHGGGQWMIPLSPEAADELASMLRGRPHIEVPRIVPQVRG